MRRSAPSRWVSYGYLLLNTLVWSVAFVAVKPAYEVTTPFRYLLYRFILASLLSIPIFIYYWPKVRPSWKVLGQITLLELGGTTFALSLLYIGLQFTTTIEANLLTTTAPIFVTLACIFILKERVQHHEWVGLTLSFLGTVGLTLLPSLAILSWTGQWSIEGNLLIFASNMANALYFPYSKKIYHGLPKLFGASLSFLVGMVSFAALSWWEIGGSVSLLWTTAQLELQSPAVWIACGYMATFGSIIGLTAYIKGQDGIEASEAILFSYLTPLFAIPAGIVFMSESVTWLQGVWVMVILVGVIIAEKRFAPLRQVAKKAVHTSPPHRRRR